MVWSVINIIITVGSAIGAVGVITAFIVKIIKKMFSKIESDIRQLDIRQSRLFLVNFMSEVERGIDKDEIEWEFAYETYDHYTKDLKQNSYIHDRWNEIIK